MKVDDQGMDFCLIPLEFCLPEWYFMKNTMDEGLGMNFGMAVPLDYSTISRMEE